MRIVNHHHQNHMIRFCPRSCTSCWDSLLTVKLPEAPLFEVINRIEKSLSTQVMPSARVLLSVSALTAADEHKCWAPSLIPVSQLWSSCLFLQKASYWPSSIFTPPPNQIAQVHSHILNLEPICAVKIQTGLLRRSEVGYTVEPPADLTWSVQGQRADRSFTPHHPQLQHPSGLLFAHALVTHVHIQNVGSSAVDVDGVVLLANQTHHTAAVDVTELQRLIGWDVWREKCGVCDREGKVKKGEAHWFSLLWNFQYECQTKRWRSHQKINLLLVTHLRWHQTVCAQKLSSVKKRHKLTLGLFLFRPFLMLAGLFCCHYDSDIINVAQSQCFFKGHTALLCDPLMFDSGKHKACLFDTVVKWHGVKTGRLTETRESLTMRWLITVLRVASQW